MKKTRRAIDIKMASELLSIRKKRTQLKAREQEIKKHFEKIMGKETELLAGNFYIYISNYVQTNIDREKLLDFFGETKMKRFEIIKPCSRFKIEKAD